MQSRTHAALGAWTLGPTPPTQAWGDAFRSIELVGTVTGTQPGEDEELDVDPIEAARTWLDDPDRAAVLPEDLREHAHRSLEFAAVHLHEMDVLAGDVARSANEAGEVDPLRLEQVDAMALQLRTYAQQLRDLLDPEQLAAERAKDRLQRGLVAAETGGLTALVAALSDPR